MKMNAKEIIVCSDSKAPIKALLSFVTSKLVNECKYYLNQNGLRNRITLTWVTGHSVVKGNERADELTRLGLSDIVLCTRSRPRNRYVRRP